MKINSQSKPRSSGFVLLLVLLLSAFSLIILAGMMNRTSTVSLLNQRNTQLSVMDSAAEAAVVEGVVRTVPGPGGGPNILCTVYRPQVRSHGRASLLIHLYGSGGSHTEFNLARHSYDLFRRLMAERGYWIVVPELGPHHWMGPAACASTSAMPQSAMSV